MTKPSNESAHHPRKFVVVVEAEEGLRIFGLNAAAGEHVPTGSWNGGDLLDMQEPGNESDSNNETLDRIQAIITQLPASVNFNEDTLHIREVPPISLEKNPIEEL